ncbi:MAG: prepilin-type N-terminal cleavage/methylation domain-containing protein [Leptolyngbyaceae cyanobacterium SL_5_9]|nr:prepilin-type N-terminal cleavage/methylation domain-containing protein [Leptolyngbyaceae cyanobacterium SL_5_9]NJO77043.1 prepilin-type N-terminal cleavage/methylation domain-containing protein [Leptolyngbyaceae cyanobacterium RM1_406_9]
MKLHRLRVSGGSDRPSWLLNQGFTLIELLVVICVMGILAAIAIPNFVNLVDQTRVNLLSEQIRQSLKEAQQQAILEGRNQTVHFRKTNSGIQVAQSPYTTEPGEWRTLSPSIPADRLVFSIPDSNNSLTFTPEGNIEYEAMVFVALGTDAQPRVSTRRCINVLNQRDGISYVQINQDTACEIAPNISPYLQPAPGEIAR